MKSISGVWQCPKEFALLLLPLSNILLKRTILRLPSNRKTKLGTKHIYVG
jgi:hypothetical protein